MKRQQRARTLAILLVFGLLMSMMPSGAITLPVQAAPQASGATAELSPSTFRLDDDCQLLQYVDEAVFAAGNHVARLKSKESLDTYVFLNADGTQTVYYMDGNVKFLDKDGVVREKDISLNATRAGFTTASNDVALTLPNDLSKGISLSYGGYDVTMIPENITAATVRQENGKVIYANSYGKGTDLIYTPTLTGLKEDIRLTSYMGVNSFSFLLNTDGLRLYTDEQGRYYFATGAKAEFKLELADIVAYDANARFSVGSMTVTPITMGQQYRLTVTVSEEFLTAETTTYPVMIDPTISVSDGTHGDGAIEDATVYANQPNLNTGTWTYNHVGYYNATYGMGWAVYKLSGLLNDSTYQSIAASNIESAYLYLTEASGSAGQVVNLYPLSGNSSWTETNITWANKGTYINTLQEYKLMQYNQTAVFNITYMVQQWKSGNYDGNCGFALLPANEQNPYKAIIGAEYGVPEKQPYIVVTYSMPSRQYLLRSNGQIGGYFTFLTPSEISFANGTSINAARLSTHKYTSLSQNWNVTQQEDGKYTISTIYKTNLFITANTNSTVSLTQNPTGSAHLWLLEDSSGSFIFRNCAYPSLVLTAPTSINGPISLSAYSEGNNAQRWVLIENDPEGMLLLDSTSGMPISVDDDAGRDLYVNESKTLTELGLTLCIFDPYNDSDSFWITIDSPDMASFNGGNLSIAGLNNGDCIARIMRAINGTLYECAFDLHVFKLVEVVVLYDYGYAERYGESSASGLILEQMAVLADKYRTTFNIDVQYSTPTKFQSYADTCPNGYGIGCSLIPCGLCGNSSVDTEGNITFKNDHHKNAYNILVRLPQYENAKTLAFIGHTTCKANTPFCTKGKQYGLSAPSLGVAEVMDHRDEGSQEMLLATMTLLHEFGHLFGAEDHYGEDGTSIINGLYGTTLFNSNCIYGENAFNDLTRDDVASSLPFCEGCKSLIFGSLSSATSVSTSHSSSVSDIRELSEDPVTRYTDLDEYRWKTYLQILKPGNFVTWDNLYWMGNFSQYQTYQAFPLSYSYSADNGNVSLSVAHHDPLFNCFRDYTAPLALTYRANKPIAAISTEMTSMVNALPQNSYFKIKTGIFEYLYAPDGELVSIEWTLGNTLFSLRGNFEDYSSEKTSVIGKLLSISPTDRFIAQTTIVWNTFVAPEQFILISSGVIILIAIAFFKKRRYTASQLNKTEAPAEDPAQ